MATWWIYIIRCLDNSLYTGITTDVVKRFGQHVHNQGRGAKYLRGRQPLTLVLTKKVGSRSLALRLESKIKKLKKSEKEALLTDTSRIDQIINIISDQALAKKDLGSG